MPTVQEVLKLTGLSDDDIRRVDERAITGFNRVLGEAQSEREAAELAQRSNVEFYEGKIVPALTGWESERNQILTERDAAQQQARYFQAAAQAAGIPVASPETGQNGYVGGDPNTTPGSPSFRMADIDAKIGSGLGNVAWALQTYSRLHGGTLPDDIENLAREADARRVPFRDFVSQKYNFAQRERDLADAKQKAHDDQIRHEATVAADRRWAEQTGSNPDVRMGQASRFGDLQRAVRHDARPDPLKLDESQRRQATRSQIRTEIAERESS